MSCESSAVSGVQSTRVFCGKRPEAWGSHVAVTVRSLRQRLPVTIVVLKGLAEHVPEQDSLAEFLQQVQVVLDDMLLCIEGLSSRDMCASKTPQCANRDCGN